MMDERAYAAAVARALEARARELGVTPDELRERAGREAPAPSIFDLVAARTGRTGEELLRAAMETARRDPYPTPACLQPADVEAFVLAEEVSPEQERHVTDCRGCRNLIAMLTPPREFLDRFRRHVADCPRPRAGRP